MIFDVATIVYKLGQYIVLDSGDLILTGTPEWSFVGPFPYAADGDVVEVDVEGLGSSRQRMT